MPVNMTANQMRLAAKIVGGESIIDTANEMGGDGGGDEDENNFERLHVSDSEDESFGAIEMDRQNRLQKTRDLVYNDSDDEHELDAITASHRASTMQDNVFDKIRTGNNDKMDQNERQRERVDQMELSNIQADNAGMMATAAQFDSEDFNSHAIRRRLADLGDSDEDSNDNGFGIWTLWLYICLRFVFFSLVSNFIVNCLLYSPPRAANEIDKITNDVDDDDSMENRMNSTNKRDRSISDHDVTMSNDNPAADDDDDEPIARPQKKARLSIIDDDSDDD